MSQDGDVDFRDLFKRSLVKISELKSRLEEVDHAQAEPIAIVGMGCRFPGGATSPEAYWQLLQRGVDAVREIPSDRWPAGAIAETQPGAKWAGLLDKVDGFDAPFFGISPREAVSMDPQQRLLLEVAWEALEHSGLPPDRLVGSRTGVFIGVMTQDYQQQVTSAGTEQLDAYSGTGTALCFTAGRLSYVLGLQGPCMSIDTACSSSLVAVHLACRSLRSKESDLAMAGGVNLILSPQTMQLIAHMQALSPDGRCKTFDASANGFVRGEGCGVVVLKRLSDAQRGGDRIWAVIRGSAVNQDGRSTGLTTPNVLSQQALLREALRDARVSPSQVSYVEAHGTGTSLGDPIEMEALTEVLGHPRTDGSVCAIGSVKTNLGHLEPAAGVAGLMKVVLSLTHEAIPRHLHFKALNPRIRLDGTPFVIPREELPWRAGGTPRVAGVSSFGLSGTNAHVIVEEAPRGPEAKAAEGDEARALLLPLSARGAEALAELARSYRDHLSREEAGASLADVAYTAGVRRSHHEHRLSVVGTSRAELARGLDAFLRGQGHPGVSSGRRLGDARPRVVFVFPGQGSQWPGMGRQLLAQEPVFRQALESCDAAIRQEVDWSLLDVLQGKQPDGFLDRIDVVQPVLFALEVALAALWRSWGVEPDAVVGHSMGEVAAAHVAGALSLEDAARIICRRSRLLRRVSGRGAMAVVELSMSQAAERLVGHEDKLSIAVSNSARSTVLAGDPGALDALLGKLEAEGVFCRRVKVDVASHSPQMDPLREDLLAALSGLAPRAGTIPIHSTVTGQVSDGASFDAGYWARNLREPVRFGQAVERLAESGPTLFVEVSPHPILLPAIEPVVRGDGREGAAVSSLRREQPERAAMLESLGALYAHDFPVDFGRLFPSGGRCVTLPSYAWQRERHWIGPAKVAGSTLRARQAGAHPLLGVPFTTSTQPNIWLWESELAADTPSYLADHRVQDAVVVPAAAYVEMALAAARHVFGPGTCALEDVVFHEALTFPEGATQTVQLALTEQGPGVASFRVSSRQDGGDGAAKPTWRLHASGQLRMSRSEATEEAPGHEPLEVVRARCGTEVTGPAYYEALAGRGLGYGPSFQGVQQVWQGEGEALGRLRPAGADGHRLHPALLDAGFQVLMAAMAGREEGNASPAVPTGLRRLHVHRWPTSDVWSHARARPGDARSPGVLEGDVLLLDASGSVLVEALGLRVQQLEQKGREEEDDFFLVPEWELAQPLAVPAESSGRKPPGRWLLLAGEGGLASAVQALLEARGEAVVRATASALASPEAFDALLRGASSGGGAPYRGVVHLWGLDSASPEETRRDAPIEAEVARECGGVLHLVQALARAGWRDPPRLWLVTRGTQVAGGGKPPVAVAQAPLWGLGRTIAYEHPELRCTRVDLAPAGFAAEAEALAAELLGTSTEEEIALRPEGRYLGRLVRQAPRLVASESMAPARGRPFRLEIDEPGVLDRLTLRATRRRPPGPGEVELEVSAAGLNFIDVMKALGIYPGLPAGPVPLGGECAGRIVALGEGVKGLHPGQEVLAISPFSFATHVTTRATLVCPRPKGLPPEEAASIPLVFMTAWYALHHLARLQPGESILIHSATGGTGLAAVQMARRVGAKIFATAGSPEKRAYLHELGITHVMDSRSLTFAEEIMAATGGQGVDVVLNSLSGEAIEKSISVLAQDGRFLELGKKDIYADHRSLSMAVFRRRISFHAVDLLGFAEQRPDRFSALFREVLSAFERGELRPTPVQVFPISRAEEAFRSMARAQHTGKLVVSFGDPDVQVAAPVEEGSRFREDASYLITGGLGGLGLSVAKWMVAQGARHLALVGRQGAATAAQAEAVSALEAAGAQVLVARADVADRAQLAGVLQDLARRMPALRGVIHAAVVLDDGVLAQQDVARFRKVMAPKIAGAWNLHELTREASLDFFVLYSSAASLLGSPGQSNYAAANAFLDALAHHRRSLGLPALSIDWGAFSEVGLAAAQENRGARLAHRGMRSLTPEEGTTILGRLMSGGVTHLGVVPLDARQWIEFYPQAASSPRLAPLVQSSARAHSKGGNSALRSALLAAAAPERRAMMEQLIREQLAQVLRLEPARIENRTPFKNLGIDSLMGLELRNRLESSLGLTLSATLLWTYPNVTTLAEHLGGKLETRPKPEAAEAEARESGEDDLSGQQESLSGLSDEELASLVSGNLADQGEDL